MVAKIADFGLTKVVNEGSLTAGVGHIGFMAPEVIANNDYGVAIDVWSFGVLICHVLHLSFGLKYDKDGANPDEAKYDPFFPSRDIYIGQVDFWNSRSQSVEGIPNTA
jgi:serine/threonine protein kinase